MTEILTATTPVLLSALIGAIVAWHLSERQALVANVTLERAKWRERIRSLACELQSAVARGDEGDLGRLRMAFRLSLNPWDAQDREIVALLSLLIADRDRVGDLEAVAIRLELLLKHDWERAKAEASWFAFRSRSGPRGRKSRAGADDLSRFRARYPIDARYGDSDAN